MLVGAGLQLKREPPPIPSHKGVHGDGGGVEGEGANGKRRRPAPAAPKRRRRAPAVPPTDTPAKAARKTKNSNIENEADISAAPSEAPSRDEPESETQVQDAYARYEQFLARQASRPARSRANSAARPTSIMLSPTASAAALPGNARTSISPQLTGQTSPSLPPSSLPTASTTSAPMSPQSSLHAAPHSGKEKEGRFSGFISRIKTAAGADSETPSTVGRKVISGPIVRVQQPGEGDEGALAGAGGEEDRMDGLGKTWASLVDEEVLKTMNARERKRQEVRQCAAEPRSCILVGIPEELTYRPYSSSSRPNHPTTETSS